ncbi:MAG: DUF4825 domain-containing protein [Lachnospiraceae bacterium]|nr:DUF4825 domain-containing protein [Lachnospiraceae bacterium]
MSKIPCAVIKDLMPSYIDRLTSSESDALIREHLDGCESCKKALEAMQGGQDPEESPEAAAMQQGEIDYLKKNRRKNQAVFWGSIAAAAVIICAVVFLRLYVIGSRMPAELASVETTVEHNKVSVAGRIGDAHYAAGKPSVTEKDGVVEIRINEVLGSPVGSKEFHVDLEAKDEVRMVKMNDRILWAAGKRISSDVSAIYETGHAYMGDPSANHRTASALHLSEDYGPFTNELLTAQQPYTWKIVLTEDIPGERLSDLEEKMTGQAYLCMAVIGNLDAVTFTYTSGGEAMSKTCSCQEATEFFGTDVRGCREDIALLQSLYDKLNF